MKTAKAKAKRKAAARGKKPPAERKPSFLQKILGLAVARKEYAFESNFAKGARFLVLFIIFAATAYALLAFTPVKHGLGFAAASSSQLALQALGVQSQRTVLENGNYALLANGFTAELNDACAALIEIAVLFGIVFASFEKTPADRIKGFAAGLLLLLILNPIRIALSIIYIDPLVHDVLFRVTLIIVIVGFYAVWYYGLAQHAVAGLRRVR